MRCIEVGISIADLDFFEVGEIMDILIERQNDSEKYDTIASQDFYDKF